MNKLLICRLLGLISLLVGAAMTVSLPWAFPWFGETEHFDARGFFGLLGAMALCGAVGGAMMYVGRRSAGDHLFRREAIAVVGLSWVLATVLGAVPFWLGRTCAGTDENGRPIPMGLFDGLFESASGFSGTGATVLPQLEDPAMVPRAILFWRSETHFLGGLGIMVLFVAILGLGSAGKTLMLTEMPGPSQEAPHARTQHAAQSFAVIFVGLNVLLTVALRLQGVSWFDSLCHAFGTIATGGFSTYNASIEHFQNVGVEMTFVVGMFLGCTNFTLLYFLTIWQPDKLWKDVEFRVYAAIMASVAAAVAVSLYLAGNYDSWIDSARYGVFQVVSIMTNTGFGTADFDRWNGFSRGALLVLMFIGGCAGSTSCSVKVIRYILFIRILGVETERVFHPSVVRLVRLGDKPLSDPSVRDNTTLFLSVFVMVFVVAWVLLLAFEPDATWLMAGQPAGNKLIDCASAVAATLNGVGPGLGIVGESQNYSHLHGASKFVLTWTMLLGRLEVFVLGVLILPRFWRT